eukprot:8103990-Lingulodinium_polyedra.AAC.1
MARLTDEKPRELCICVSVWPRKSVQEAGSSSKARASAKNCPVRGACATGHWAATARPLHGC